LAAGNALVAMCGPAGLSLYLNMRRSVRGVGRAPDGDVEDGTAMRRSRARLIEQGGLAFAPFFCRPFAGLEAEARRLDAASALVEKTLTKAAQTGSHFSDSTLVRLRGDILLKCNPANCAPIEDLDIYSTKSWDRNALLQPESRAAYQRLLAQGWTDAIRALHPKEPMYTFWDYMRKRWERDGRSASRPHSP
jgi:hypothetical protein